MKNRMSYLFTIICAVVIFTAANSAPAQTPQLRATNQQLQNLLNRIDSKIQTLQSVINRNTNYGQTRDEGLIDMVQDLASAKDSLQSRIDSRQNSGSEATDLLRKASQIDNFIAGNRVTGGTATQWKALKCDLNTLASYYRMNWNWNQSGNYNSNYPGL